MGRSGGSETCCARTGPSHRDGRVARTLTAGLLAAAVMAGAKLPQANAAEPQLLPEPRGHPAAQAAADELAAGGSFGGKQTRRGRRLSDERTWTRWAYVRRSTPVRAAPRPKARRIGKLSRGTEDRTRELAIALRLRRTGENGRWIKVRFANRGPQKGWVRRRQLDRYHLVRTRLDIDRSSFTAKLFRRGRRVWRGRVGVGKPGAPTPSGRYFARTRLVPSSKGGIYGVFAFGTSAYSSLSDWPRGGVVGIHGTNQPGLIPGRISHGCIRLPNRKIAKLRRLMPLGTPIRIR